MRMPYGFGNLFLSTALHPARSSTMNSTEGSDAVTQADLTARLEDGQSVLGSVQKTFTGLVSAISSPSLSSKRITFLYFFWFYTA